MNRCVSARMKVIRGLRQQKHTTIGTIIKFMAFRDTKYPLK